MKINRKFLYTNYKEIQKTSLENGVPIPFMISPYHISNKYKCTFNEIMGFDIPKEKLKEKEMKRKKEEYDIIKGKVNKTIREYWLNELNEWVKEFPQFNNIIIE